MENVERIKVTIFFSFKTRLQSLPFSFFTHSLNLIMKEVGLWPQQWGNLVISAACHFLGSAAMAEENVFIKLLPADLQPVDNPQNP